MISGRVVTRSHLAGTRPVVYVGNLSGSICVGSPRSRYVNDIAVFNYEWLPAGFFIDSAQQVPSWSAVVAQSPEYGCRCIKARQGKPGRTVS